MKCNCNQLGIYTQPCDVYCIDLSWLHYIRPPLCQSVKFICILGRATERETPRAITTTEIMQSNSTGFVCELSWFDFVNNIDRLAHTLNSMPILLTQRTMNPTIILYIHTFRESLEIFLWLAHFDIFPFIQNQMQCKSIYFNSMLT